MGAVGDAVGDVVSRAVGVRAPARLGGVPAGSDARVGLATPEALPSTCHLRAGACGVGPAAVGEDAEEPS